MPYIKSMDRNQMMMCSIDSFVDPESVARVIDVFVESLDLKEMGFEKTEAAAEGRPSYPPESLLKLYLYGNRKGIRSSRKLEEACRINVEARWLVEGLEPDFRTISDFRKDNIDCMKKVFHEFNSRLYEVLASGYMSVDGSKFRACNGKDNNFTANKLDDRIEWLNRHADEYLRQIGELDEAEDAEETAGQFSREELEMKLKETRERLERYEGYRKYMEEKGLSQMSLTDPDAKLMKSRNGFEVSYNVQTAVDSETHLVKDYQMTNHPTDHGLLESTLSGIKEEKPGEPVEAVADKGYIKEEDMVSCLENGIIPHVIPRDGQDTYGLETGYEEAEIDEETKKSGKAEDIKKCLHAGEIPDAYKEVIESAEVEEKKEFVPDETEEAVEEKESAYGSEEEMKARAAQGYFVRDPERNLVYCPGGKILRQKSVKKNGNIRYANKTACRNCPNRDKCYQGKGDWKEIDFNKDTLEKPCKKWLEAEGTADTSPRKKRKGHYETKKTVKLVFRPSREKMGQRKCLSEHPFGTVKRWMNAGYYLLRGIRKTGGETALIFLAYNLSRGINLLGFKKMMEIMA